MASGKKNKDVLEMLGDFLREAAVLVLVFFPLDMALKDGGNIPFTFFLLVGCLSLLLLIGGIVFEKLRG